MEVKLESNVPAIKIVDVPSECEKSLNNAIDRMKKKLKDNPLSIIPPNLACEEIKFKDPLQVIATYEPNLEDLGTLCETVIGCIPVVGGVFAGVFNIFWSNSVESENVTKEQVNKMLDNFRNEMISTIEKKIKDNDIESWKAHLTSHLEGLSETCAILFDDLATLKYKLVSKENVSESLLDGVRNKLDILQDKVLTVMSFCGNKKYFKHVYQYYLQSVLIYVLYIHNVDSFWYQYGIDEIKVVGRPARPDLNLSPVLSFREKLHQKTNKSLRKMNNLSDLKTCYLNVVNKIPEEKIDTTGLENLHMLLKGDIITYPVPLICHEKEEIPKICDGSIPMHKVSESAFPIPTITIPDRKGPFIYRIDAVNMRPDPKAENISLGRTIPDRELITGCKGLFLETSPSIILNFPTSRFVRLRVYAASLSDTIPLGMPFSFEKYELKHQGEEEQLGVLLFGKKSMGLPYYNEVNMLLNRSGGCSIDEEHLHFSKSYIGYFVGKKVKRNTVEISLSGVGRVFFIEAVVSDE